ncbi:MAG: lipoate--protein ligase family protein [Thermoguttaceae bacterium]|jgi:lipoate-protein ligase A
MRYLDLSLPTPAENLALDEALLDEAEAAGRPVETLRTWESDCPLVILGRSSRADAEVHRDACRRLEIPIHRRASGGAAVVVGPGCLMYALVLSCQERPALRAVAGAHRTVLSTIAAALAPLLPGIHCDGTSDLVLGGRKVSGNSLRAKREHLLYHGTLLYDFPLELISECLAMPPRRPAYRGDRPHADFLAKVPISPAALRQALRAAWHAEEPRHDWPRAAVARLAAERYNEIA